MAYLGNAGGTGQVLTVSGGAPVWQASSPTLLWDADLTTGQTAGAWTVPSTGNVIVGSSGTGNLNWGTTNFSGTAWGVAMVNGSGLELTAPAAPSGTSQLGVWAFLQQLDLSFWSGRPWRMWIQSTKSGSIGGGGSGLVEYWVGGLNDPISAGADTIRTTLGGGAGSGGVSNGAATSFATSGFGTDRSASPGNAVWYSSDVFCLTSFVGSVTTAFGTYGSGWPALDTLYTANSGAIQLGKLPTLASPYLAKSIFYFLPYVAGGTYTNLKIIVKRIRIEGL